MLEEREDLVGSRGGQRGVGERGEKGVRGRGEPQLPPVVAQQQGLHARSAGRSVPHLRARPGARAAHEPRGAAGASVQQHLRGGRRAAPQRAVQNLCSGGARASRCARTLPQPGCQFSTESWPAQLQATLTWLQGRGGL